MSISDAAIVIISAIIYDNWTLLFKSECIHVALNSKYQIQSPWLPYFTDTLRVLAMMTASILVRDLNLVGYHDAI